MDTFENVHDFLEFTNFKITELRNHFVKCYTGDLEFLYAALGLQGACSMYPNPFTTVHRHHLKIRHLHSLSNLNCNGSFEHMKDRWITGAK